VRISVSTVLHPNEQEPHVKTHANNRNSFIGVFVLLSLGLITPAAAQLSNLAPEVGAKIAAMGPQFSQEVVGGTFPLFAPYAKAARLTGVNVARDIAYGADPLNKLDIYQPEGKRGMPIVAFVHGGGYVGGDKNANGIFFGNVTAYFARHGMLGVNINYRLAPKNPFPAASEDLDSAVAWIRENGEKYGGDPGRIFLFGHSAGATHVASYLFDASLHPRSGGISGAVLVSGLYRITGEIPLPGIKAYFGADAAQYAARAPISHVKENRTPLFLVMAEYDPPFLATDSFELAREVCVRDGKCPRFTWLKGHNHVSQVASFDSPDEELGLQILGFIRNTSGPTKTDAKQAGVQ